MSKDQVQKMYALAQELKAKAHNVSHKMLDGGLISQAEYDAKKADILSRM